MNEYEAEYSAIAKLILIIISTFVVIYFIQLVQNESPYDRLPIDNEVIDPTTTPTLSINRRQIPSILPKSTIIPLPTDDISPSPEDSLPTTTPTIEITPSPEDLPPILPSPTSEIPPPPLEITTTPQNNLSSKYDVKPFSIPVEIIDPIEKKAMLIALNHSSINRVIDRGNITLPEEYIIQKTGNSDTYLIYSNFYDLDRPELWGPNPEFFMISISHEKVIEHYSPTSFITINSSIRRAKEVLLVKQFLKKYQNPNIEVTINRHIKGLIIIFSSANSSISVDFGYNSCDDNFLQIINFEIPKPIIKVSVSNAIDIAQNAHSEGGKLEIKWSRKDFSRRKVFFEVTESEPKFHCINDNWIVLGPKRYDDPDVFGPISYSRREEELTEYYYSWKVTFSNKGYGIPYVDGYYIDVETGDVVDEYHAE